MLSMLSVIALSFAVLVKSDDCNVLVLSGGGSFGAFQAGVINGLQNSLNPKWDLITGVSAGSLNGGFLGLFPQEKQVEAIDTLKDIWLNVINESRIYTWNHIINPNNWYSILNNDPLRDFISETLQKYGAKVQRPLLIGTTDLSTGGRIVYNESDLNIGLDNYTHSLMASTAIPVLFPPENYQNTLYIDGGMVSNELILPSIQKCYEMGKENINFDIIICSKLIDKKSLNDLEKLRLIGLMERDIEIAENTFFNHQIFSTCLDKSKRFPINLYSPPIVFNWTMINFDHQHIETMFNTGIKSLTPTKFTYCY